MLRVATAQEMRELDRRATADYGIPSLLLMEAAGAETVRELLEAFPDAGSGRVVVVAGRGNNGGDGFVVARRLLARGAAVRTFLLAGADAVQGDAAVNLDILRRLGAAPEEVRGASGLPAVREALAGADVVVDALLGTGARGAAAGAVAECIAAVNAARRPVVAVDVPSGLGADRLVPEGPVVQADLTVTFALPKPSLLLYPAARFAGRLRVVDIGIPPALVGEACGLALLEPRDVAPAFPARDPAGHKGTYGHVLVVAGSAGKTGAAAMTAEAALRSGAGLVTLAVPESLQDVLATKLTEVMTEGLPETEGRTLAWEAVHRLRELAVGRSAVALGPGLGTHPATAKLIRELLASLALPVVVDADALNVLAGQAGVLRGAPAARILTPHPGEMARLLGRDRDTVLADRLDVVPRTARELGVTLVLKTARTLIAGPTGPAWVVPTGNPGMATAGSGDVLTGVVAGLLAQGAAPGRAACAGAYLHGLAGDLAAGRLGQEAMLAGDLLRHLPEAIRAVRTSALCRMPGGRSGPRTSNLEPGTAQP
jgi:NAD(P)H-hydrate epimerase